MRPTLLRANLRSSIRRAVRVECEVVRDRDFRLVGSAAVDLSTDGILVESDVPVLTGEDLVVAFKTPSGRWFDCTATVARVVHGRRPYDTGRFLGVHFESIDDAQTRALEMELSGLPPPLPRRPIRVDFAAKITRFLTSDPLAAFTASPSDPHFGCDPIAAH